MRDEHEESRPYTPIDFNTKDSNMIRWIVRNSDVSAEHQVESWMNIRGKLKLEIIKGMRTFDLPPDQVGIVYEGSTDVEVEVGNLIKKRRVKSGEIINYKRFFLVREAQVADPGEVGLTNVRLSPTEEIQIIVIDRRAYEDTQFTVKEKIMALHKKPSQRLLSDIPKLTQLIQDLPIFSKVDEKSRMDLAQGMVLESFSKRRAVFEEGDKGDGFYTIIFGRCDVYMREKTMEAVKQAMDSRVSEDEPDNPLDWAFSKDSGHDTHDNGGVDDSADKQFGLKNNDDNNNNNERTTTMNKSSPPASPREEPVHSGKSQEQDGQTETCSPEHSERAQDGEEAADGEGKEKEADSRDEIGDLDYLRKVKNIPHEFKGDKNTSNTNQDSFSEDYFTHQSLNSSLFESKQEEEQRWGEHVAVLIAGQSFGEMALLNSINERTATVVASAGVKLAKISREDFNKIIMQLEKNRLDSEISFLKTIYQGLSFLSRKDAMAQLFSFRRRELPRGVVLATAGSPAKEIIIIREGSVLLVDTQTDAERPGSGSKSTLIASYHNQNDPLSEQAFMQTCPYFQSAVPVSVIGPTAILGDESLNYVFSKGSMQLLKGKKGTHSFTAVTLSTTKILTMPQKEALVLIFPSLRNAIRDNGAVVRQWRAARSQKAAKIKDSAQDTQGLEGSVATGAVTNTEEGGGDSRSNTSSKKKPKDMNRASGKHNSRMTLSKMSSASQWDPAQLKSGSHRKATELSQRPNTNRKFLEFLMDCSWSLNHTTFTPS